jgi:hypothetical protein
VSQRVRKFFENLKDAATEMLPGLKNIVPELGAELKQMGAHGAHELAAALFNGQGFVMYPRAGKESVEDQQHGQPAEVEKAREEQSQGGREM